MAPQNMHPAVADEARVPPKWARGTTPWQQHDFEFRMPLKLVGIVTEREGYVQTVAMRRNG